MKGTLVHAEWDWRVRLNPINGWHYVSCRKKDVSYLHRDGTVRSIADYFETKELAEEALHVFLLGDNAVHVCDTTHQ